MAAPDWRPLPWPPSLGALDCLFRHHAIQADVAPGDLWRRSAAEAAKAAPALADLGVAAIRRLTLVRETLAALRAGGVGKMMLVKGEALAPLYPSPALRRMGDVDLVLDPGDLEPAAAALRASGFDVGPAYAADNWLHPSGLMLDLHAPEAPLPTAMFERAEPHPDFAEIPGVPRPQPADHPIVIALHTAQSYGGRIWRDVRDVQARAGLPDAPAAAAKALERATEFGHDVQLAALFRFMNRHAAPPFAFPERPADDFDSDAEGGCERAAAHYAELAVTPASPAALGLLWAFFSHESFFRRLLVLLGRLRRHRREELPEGPRSSPWSESSAELGQVPSHAKLGRQ